MKDFGVTGSEDLILDKCLGEGSKHLIMGFVINPNTCMDQEDFSDEMIKDSNAKVQF